MKNILILIGSMVVLATGLEWAYDAFLVGNQLALGSALSKVFTVAPVAAVIGGGAYGIFVSVRKMVRREK